MRLARAALPPPAAPRSRLWAACAVWAAGCGAGATGPDGRQPETPPATPTVAFASKLVGAPEGGTAVLRLRVDPAPESAVTLGYTIGVDDDAGTDDADSVDYAGDPAGTVRIGAGDAVGIIQVVIHDDNDIEPAREVLTVTLDAPPTGAGLVLGSPHKATVLIEEGVCDRTPRIRDEILRITGAGHCLEPNREDLAGIADLELCNRKDWPLCRREDAVIPALRQGDFQGLTQLERLALAGVGLKELPVGVFSGLGGLRTLWLANNRFTGLPDRLFSGLSSLGSLSLSGNRLAGLPAGLFSGLTALWWLELSGNPIKELPPGVFSGLANLSGLVIVSSELSELPPRMFVGLSKLRSLDLRANPGTPFALSLQIVRIDNEDLMAPGPAEIAVQTELGSPFAAEVILFTEGAGLLRDTLDIGTGHARSTTVTVRQDSAGTEGTRITVHSVSEAPEDIRGVDFRAADPILLFASSSGARPPTSAGSAGSLLRATLSPPVRATSFAAPPARAGELRRREWRKQ